MEATVFEAGWRKTADPLDISRSDCEGLKLICKMRLCITAMSPDANESDRVPII